MVFLKLFRFLFGYVRFIIIGEFPERLLNQFSVNSVSIWNVVRKKEYIELSIMARDYKKMRKIRAQNKVRTRIVQKYGLSFALIKYKKRAGFVCGIALFFAVLNFMSLFIWNVRVCGNTYVDESIIKKELSQIGVYEGARRSGLDTDLIKNKLTLQIEDLSWAAINIEGSRATIEVKEKRIVPPKDDNQPCNLLAKCDGFVVGFEIESGNIVVPKNTAVRKGDILVSGIVEYADKSSALKKAAGKVFAETEHEIMVEKLFLQKSIIKTGQIETRSVLDIFGISIPLFLGDIDWQYEKEIKEFKYKNENMYLPVFFTTATYNKITEAETRYNTEETIALARRDLEKKEAEMLGDSDILRREEQINVTEEGILLKTRYFCKENIAKPEILLITTIN